MDLACKPGAYEHLVAPGEGGARVALRGPSVHSQQDYDR
jgi:hypothetical protein